VEIIYATYRKRKKTLSFNKETSNALDFNSPAFARYPITDKLIMWFGLTQGLKKKNDPTNMTQNPW